MVINGVFPTTKDADPGNFLFVDVGASGGRRVPVFCYAWTAMSSSLWPSLKPIAAIRPDLGVMASPSFGKYKTKLSKTIIK